MGSIINENNIIFITFSGYNGDGLQTLDCKSSKGCSYD